MLLLLLPVAAAAVDVLEVVGELHGAGVRLHADVVVLLQPERQVGRQRDGGA